MNETTYENTKEMIKGLCKNHQIPSELLKKQIYRANRGIDWSL